MGLGTPVCHYCKVMAKLTDKSSSLYGAKVSWGNSYYHCPSCNSVDYGGHLWEFDEFERIDIWIRTLLVANSHRE